MAEAGGEVKGMDQSLDALIAERQDGSPGGSGKAPRGNRNRGARTTDIAPYAKSTVPTQGRVRGERGR